MRIRIPAVWAILAVVWIALLAPDVRADVPSDHAEPLSVAAIQEVLERVMTWQLQHPKHELWEWPNGVFYAGIMAVYQAYGRQAHLDELTRMGEANAWKPGPHIHYADDHTIAQTYLDLARVTGNQRAVEPFRGYVDLMMRTHDAWVEQIGVIEYWWCDALFMSPPALAKLARITGDDRYLAFMHQAWAETYDELYDSEDRLFYRDERYTIDVEDRGPREKNGEKIFWSRGNAWVLAGLARLIPELAMADPKLDFYTGVFRAMARRVAEIQPRDGLWRASLLDPDAYPAGESSGTALFTYALAWGVNNDLLDEDRIRPVIERAWKALYDNVDSKGRLGWVQAIGGEPAAAGEADWESYGSGAFLLAGSEVGKLFGHGTAGVDR
jgi:rhamnogalacturonyl hydrolase YesR